MRTVCVGIGRELGDDDPEDEKEPEETGALLSVSSPLPPVVCTCPGGVRDRREQSQDPRAVTSAARPSLPFAVDTLLLRFFLANKLAMVYITVPHSPPELVLDAEGLRNIEAELVHVVHVGAGCELDGYRDWRLVQHRLAAITRHLQSARAGECTGSS
ncbi:unnamed protein product [Peniophora sp. CBMAI 1063]|nr:unnamed protein product [Peniophora sp. CBMAI 1063]